MPDQFLVRVGDTFINVYQISHIITKVYSSDGITRTLIPGARIIEMNNGHSLTVPKEEWTSEVERKLNLFTL
jgi:hypothetical protein